MVTVFITGAGIVTMMTCIMSNVIIAPARIISINYVAIVILVFGRRLAAGGSRATKNYNDIGVQFHLMWRVIITKNLDSRRGLTRDYRRRADANQAL